MKTKLKIKQEEGITLIALVVTIVVLLILAGISLNLVLGQNGVIGKAKDAKNLTEKGQAQDEVNLAINYLQIEDATSTLTREDKRKILEDELRKISADSSVSISGSGYKITHKKYDFFVDEDLKISSSGKTFDAVEWDKKAAPEDIFIWKSDDPNNADYGVVIGYKKNVDNYTILRFPSRCTKVTNDWNIYNSGIYNDTEDDAATIRSYTKNILKVELPDTVKELGEAAFSGEGDWGAFNFSSLERIELSKNISKIENWTFVACKNLKYVKMPDKITEIGFMAFYGCGALESITIPDGVKKIGDSSFYGCTNIQHINLPEGLEKIGYTAFSGTSLERVKLPKSLSKIEGFEGCTNLKYIEIPDNITEIGDYAFKECEKLNIEIPKNITKIGSNAFSRCNAIESITIPAGVKEISADCFRDCTNLKQINLSDGLEGIGSGAFSGCKAIESITIPAGVKEISDGCFRDCTNLKQINLSDGLEGIGSGAFLGCKAIESITIPDGVKKIGDSSFFGCTNIQQINLPDGLEKIGYRAFDDTTSLSEIILPESVKTIDKYAFSGWKASQTIKCKATKAGDNWDKYWNYNYSYFSKDATKISANIIWGYQDNNT